MRLSCIRVEGSDFETKPYLVLGCVLLFSGLRTLCFAVAEISESDFQEWRAVYQRASTSVQNRLLKLEESYELIEKVREGLLLLIGKVWFSDNFSLFKEPINKDQNVWTHCLLSSLPWSEREQMLAVVRAFAEKSVELLYVDLHSFL